MTHRRKLAVLISAIAGTLVVLVSLAAAASTKPTQITIKNFPSDDGVSGTLSSTSASCENERVVKVYREKPGDDKLIGTTKSEAAPGPKAKWEKRGFNSHTGQIFYAIAPRETRSGGSIICAKVKSNGVGFLG